MMRRPRTNYDIRDFKFTSLHKCGEYKYKKCVHCRSRRKCKDHIRPVYLSEEGIFYPIEEIEVSPIHAFDLGLYVHEFTEAAFIRIFRRWRKDWNKGVNFDGYNETYIVHFISMYGVNNGSCLEPATHKNRPRW